MTSNVIVRENPPHVPLVAIHSASGVSPRRYIASDISHRAFSPTTLRAEGDIEGMCSKFNHGLVDSPCGEIRSIWVGSGGTGLIVALKVHQLNHPISKYPAPNSLVTLLYIGETWFAWFSLKRDPETTSRYSIRNSKTSSRLTRMRGFD